MYEAVIDVHRVKSKGHKIDFCGTPDIINDGSEYYHLRRP